MNDMRSAIVPRSDQLNADDLIAGPITIKIRDVKIKASPEQPVSIYFDGDNDKPYKPCKSMSRCLVFLWGPDANEYVGRSLTLYRDPTAKFGGLEVGGIRISHMSDIDREQTLILTASKGSRKPYKVLPLVAKSTPAPDNATLDALTAAAGKGPDALKAAWEGLTKAQRKTHEKDLPDLKKIASAAAEASAEQFT